VMSARHLRSSIPIPVQFLVIALPGTLGPGEGFR
jgi:hypothetical protein